MFSICYKFNSSQSTFIVKLQIQLVIIGCIFSISNMLFFPSEPESYFISFICEIQTAIQQASYLAILGIQTSFVFLSFIGTKYHERFEQRSIMVSLITYLYIYGFSALFTILLLVLQQDVEYNSTKYQCVPSLKDDVKNFFNFFQLFPVIVNAILFLVGICMLLKFIKGKEREDNLIAYKRKVKLFFLSAVFTFPIIVFSFIPLIFGIKEGTNAMQAYIVVFSVFQHCAPGANVMLFCVSVGKIKYFCRCAKSDQDEMFDDSVVVAESEHDISMQILNGN